MCNPILEHFQNERKGWESRRKALVALRAAVARFDGKTETTARFDEDTRALANAVSALPAPFNGMVDYRSKRYSERIARIDSSQITKEIERAESNIHRLDLAETFDYSALVNAARVWESARNADVGAYGEWLRLPASVIKAATTAIDPALV